MAGRRPLSATSSVPSRKRKSPFVVENDSGFLKPIYDIDTETIKLNAIILKKYAEKLNKLQKDISRKTKKAKSKKLEKCKDDYSGCFEEVKDATKNIYEITCDDKPKPGTSQKEELCIECAHQKQETWAAQDALKIAQDEQKQLRHQKSKLESDVAHYKRKATEFENKVKESERNLNIALSTHDKEIQGLNKTIREERAAKEDSLRRLSSMASSKLRDNNPNITDLSDTNRPTKIAEKISEVYDNEWTDAFDELEKHFSENESIQHLLNMITTIYKECQTLSTNHYFESVQSCIEQSNMTPSMTSAKIVLPDQLKQQIKEFRKSRASPTIPHIQKVILKNVSWSKDPKYQNEAIQNYISKCVELCWLMVVQDPPLALGTDVPDKFDTDKFKDYTQRGPYVEFLVWPTLYLQAGGAVLIKGVAQGCKQPIKRSASPFITPGNNTATTVHSQGSKVTTITVSNTKPTGKQRSNSTKSNKDQFTGTNV